MATHRLQKLAHPLSAITTQRLQAQGIIGAVCDSALLRTLCLRPRFFHNTLDALSSLAMLEQLQVGLAGGS